MVKRKDNSIRADSGFKDAFIARKAHNYEGLLNERKLTDQALATMYRNALVRRIVTMAADDAMKNFVEIEGDTDDCILQELETLFVQEKLTESLYWDSSVCLVLLSLLTMGRN